MPIQIDHQNAKSTRTAIEYGENGQTLTVVVETDLPLNFGDPEYDENALQKLWNAVATQCDENGYFCQNIRLVEAR